MGSEYHNVGDISKFMHLVYCEIRKGNFDSLPDKLIPEKIKDIPVEKMLAFLRCSFLWRARIPKWYEFLDKARNELNNRGLDSEQILIGLDSKNG